MFGCVTTDQQSVTSCLPCPPEDAVTGVEIPGYGIIPFVIPKGALDDKENWIPYDSIKDQELKDGQINL